MFFVVNSYLFNRYEFMVKKAFVVNRSGRENEYWRTQHERR